MAKANWKTQPYNVIQSLLFNNPHRVIQYRVQDERGHWRNREDSPAPVRRLYETESPPERTCLQTIQFVHHMLIPPGSRHVQNTRPSDAEEMVITENWDSRHRQSHPDMTADDVVCATWHRARYATQQTTAGRAVHQCTRRSDAARGREGREARIEDGG
jgi:hypothetical protein